MGNTGQHYKTSYLCSGPSPLSILAMATPPPFGSMSGLARTPLPTAFRHYSAIAGGPIKRWQLFTGPACPLCSPHD